MVRDIQQRENHGLQNVEGLILGWAEQISIQPTIASNDQAPKYNPTHLSFNRFALAWTTSPGTGEDPYKPYSTWYSVRWDQHTKLPNAIHVPASRLFYPLFSLPPLQTIPQPRLTQSSHASKQPRVNPSLFLVHVSSFSRRTITLLRLLIVLKH